MNHDASCPACGSRKVAQRNWAKKLFGVLGTAAGATGGFAGTIRGAQIGMTAGAAAALQELLLVVWPVLF
jgi:hypothetical protein